MNSHNNFRHSVAPRIAMLEAFGKVMGISVLDSTRCSMANAPADYVTIKEAAGLLGVAENTLRNWGAAKKIEEYRHPINNYRLYRLSELRKIRAQLEKPRRAK